MFIKQKYFSQDWNTEFFRTKIFLDVTQFYRKKHTHLQI